MFIPTWAKCNSHRLGGSKESEDGLACRLSKSSLRLYRVGTQVYMVQNEAKE